MASATTTTAAPRSGSLAGKVITIDPGHDGGNATHVAEIDRKVWIRTGSKACNTVGTETNSGFAEHTFTWETALLVQAKLEARGATVVLTRPNDTGWGPCVDQRAEIGNAAHSAAAVAIHADGAAAGDRGFFVIAQSHTPGIGTALYDASGRLASSVRDAVRSGTAMPTSDYAGAAGFERSGIYGGLNLSDVPAMFIECGNMRNATDAALLESPAYRAQLADAIAAGIANFVA
jgi:N-acetylmuramoyl-L-alanine amidase